MKFASVPLNTWLGQASLHLRNLVCSISVCALTACGGGGTTVSLLPGTGGTGASAVTPSDAPPVVTPPVVTPPVVTPPVVTPPVVTPPVVTPPVVTPPVVTPPVVTPPVVTPPVVTPPVVTPPVVTPPVYTPPVATPGINVFALGPVVGFGSVIVNGIRFDDTAATVQIDGISRTSSDLRLGMITSISGSKSTATVTTTATVRAQGTANAIEVWSIAQGTINSLVFPNTFTVAGMTMVTDAGTVLEGVMSTSNLYTGSVVKVWGQPITSDFRQWAVTRLEVLSNTTDTVSTGLVSIRWSIPYLNGLVLAGNTSGIKDGQEIRAVGSLNKSATGGTLTVSKINVLSDPGTANTATGYAELQGIVTSVLATSTTTPPKVTRLTLGTNFIDISAASVSPAGAIVKQGARIEVEGTWNAGVLMATSVEVKTELQSQEVEIEAAIERFTSVADFVVRGQRCDASGLTRVGNGRLTDLKLGTKVHLHGSKSGDVVRVTELEIK
jgi:Domain of unknown function (DUF5666)